MSKRARFLIATLCGLVLAAGTHIVVIFASPFMAEHDAFNRLLPTLDEDEAQIVAGLDGTPTWLPQPDPAVAVAACAFDLENGPARIFTKTGPLFQSLTFHTRGTGVFFAVTDRAAVRGELGIVVMTPRQLDEARAAEDDSGSVQQEMRIVAPESQGFVIVRVASPFPSQNPGAENAAKAVSCTIDEE